MYCEDQSWVMAGDHLLGGGAAPLIKTVPGPDLLMLATVQGVGVQFEICHALQTSIS
jgi:hypothetical protein